MAFNWLRCVLLTTLFCLVYSQRGFYNPYQIQNGNVYASRYFRPQNRVPVQQFQPARRTDTCTNYPGSTCMFVLLCLMAGGASAGSCSGGVLSTCCVIPASQSQIRQPARAWNTGAISNNIIQPPMTKPQIYIPTTTPAPVVKTTKSPMNFSYCGITQAKPQSRIIGGNDAMYGEFPWQVHIKLNKQQCGGVLLNNYYVLTAAHCIYEVRLSDIIIQLGLFDIQDQSRQAFPPQTFSVVEKKIHPKFKYQAAHPDRYDVALLKLDRAVKYQENIIPICLPPKDWNFEGWKGITTGWGKTDTGLSNRFGTRLLQKVDVPVIANQLCEKWHQEKGIDIKIFPEMMCAGYETGQKDACVGDSGGPLVVVMNGRWTVIGLVSAGFGCAQSKQPGIYHRVANSVEWLRENISYR